MQIFRALQHLLPRSATWQLAPGTVIRHLFEGLATPFEQLREHLDRIYLDGLPQYTRRLNEWEDEFGLRGEGSEQDRRLAIAGSMRGESGGMQAVLRAAGFSVNVHAFTGNRVPGNNRSPFRYLDFESIGQVHCDSSGATRAGQPGAVCDGLVVRGSPYLVNLPAGADGQPPLPLPDEGATELQEQQLEASFLYVGGIEFPELARVPRTRRREFESRVQRLKPGWSWAGLLVEYV